MVVTEEEAKRAFERARQHVIELYPFYTNWFNNINLNISNEIPKEKTILAKTDYSKNLITVYLAIINQYAAQEGMIYDEPSMYYVFLHEFAHLLQDSIDNTSPTHGSLFKELAHNLGLENPAPITPALGHTMYILAVPRQTRSGRTVKKRYYVSQEWLDKHPAYRQFEVRHYSHP